MISSLPGGSCHDSWGEDGEGRLELDVTDSGEDELTKVDFGEGIRLATGERD